MFDMLRAAQDARLVFKKNNWTWHGEPKPPSVIYIAEVIRHLCESVEKMRQEAGKNFQSTYCETGRLRVACDRMDGSDTWTLSLELGTCFLDYDEEFFE